MEKNHIAVLQPGSDPHCHSRSNRLREVWKRINDSGDPGGIDWGGVMELQLRVMEFIERGESGDLRQAERLTAKAMFLCYGGTT